MSVLDFEFRVPFRLSFAVPLDVFFCLLAFRVWYDLTGRQVECKHHGKESNAISIGQIHVVAVTTNKFDEHHGSQQRELNGAE